MNRLLALVTVLLAGCSLASFAADSFSDVAVLATQREAEERYRRLTADIQNIQETQEVLLKRQDDFRQRLDRLADDIRTLKDEQSRSSGNSVSRDELRKYVEKLKEMDEKREGDKRLILENIKDLAKMPAAPPAESKPTSRRAAEPPDEPVLLYTIKDNDRLDDIIAAFNKDYFLKQGLPKVTKAEILKANPGLKPDLLIKGKKLRIPDKSKDAR